MGVLFTLTNPMKKTIETAFTDLINELGKPCRVFYNGKIVPCPNCIWDSTNQRGGLAYKHGGPMAFPNGTICPVCNGKDFKMSETYDNLTLSCVWDPKKFWYPIPNLDIRVPFSYVQTKGFIRDLPKVVKCDYMIFDVNIEGLVRQKYKLFSMPGDRSNIVQGKFFYCTWEQVG